MTRYSVPSETSPDNLVTPTTENYQSEVEYSDWESRMARLVGFQQEKESKPVDVEEVEESSNLEPSPPPIAEEEVRTKQRFSSNPFAKLALVGTGTLAVALIAGAFLSQLMNSTNQKPKRNNISLPQTRSQPTTQTRMEQLEGEVETLKTKLALAEQADAVKIAQQKLRTARQPQPQPTTASTRNRDAIAQRTPTPVKTVYVPRVVTRVVTQPSPKPTPSPISPPLQPPIAQPETQPVVEATPTPPPKPADPMQEWMRLAKMGSYGQVLVATSPNASSTTAQAPRNTPVEQPPTNPQPPLVQRPASTIASQAQQKEASKSVPVGTSVKAVLATAVFGETTRSSSNNANSNNRNEEPKNVFVVQLKEPLKGRDGTVALPAKTELLAEIRSLSEQGLLQLNVTKILVPNKGEFTERSLPENAITINGSGGRPLVANQFRRGGSTAGMDAGLFVLGGLGKAAEILNRSESQVRVEEGVSFVTNNTRRNFLAGVFEGGMNTIVPQIAQRNQQAMNQMMQGNKNVWFLQAGKEVEVYINQPMQF